MLTPSEIALLRQDLKAAIEVVGQDEIDDAYSLIHRYGYLVQDFEILQKGDDLPAFPAPVTGFVVIVRKSNGMTKRYEAGSGSTWLMQLDGDLKARAF